MRVAAIYDIHGNLPALDAVLGQIAEEKKDWPQAIKWYGEIQEGEQAVPARLRTANAIAKQGKLDSALEFLHKASDEFPGQVRDLMCWLRGAPLPDDHPFRAIRANPTGSTTPEVWILGSSDYGAQLAAHFGLPYAYAYFFSDGRGVEGLPSGIRPGPLQPAPSSRLSLINN